MNAQLIIDVVSPPMTDGLKVTMLRMYGHLAKDITLTDNRF